MEEYRPNSHKSKEEEKKTVEEKKKVEKIVNGAVKSKKKNEIHKLADVFIAEDASNVKEYIFMDVLIPALKKAISDVVTNGIDMILYGESGRNKKNSPSSNISYNRYYDKNRDRGSYNRTRSTYEYDDIIIDNRGEAEDVLTRMDELMDQYKVVSVADFYDLVGVTGNYTDNKYGWTDIRSASVVRVAGGGYMIKLPKALPLN